MNEAIWFGLLSALTWGAGDFCGGLATKRARAFSVVLVAELAGAALLAALALIFGQAMPTGASLVWSGLAGLAGIVGLVALYSGLASGHMGLVAPLSAVIAALVPIIASSLLEGLPQPAQVAGFGMALAAVWLLSTGGERALSTHELRLALFAGLGFGFYFVFIHQIAAEGAIFWELAFARTLAAVVLAAIMLVLRHPLWPPRQVLPLNVLNGSLDAGGNLFFALAVQAGRLDVASVLSSLYPGMTVLLAWFVLGERLNRAQMTGVAAALLAIVLIVV